MFDITIPNSQYKVLEHVKTYGYIEILNVYDELADETFTLLTIETSDKAKSDYHEKLLSNYNAALALGKLRRRIPLH